MVYLANADERNERLAADFKELSRENERLQAAVKEATVNFATYYRVAQERQDDLEQVQAKIERLKMTLMDRESLIAEYIMTEEQAQARVKRLEEALSFTMMRLRSVSKARHEGIHARSFDAQERCIYQDCQDDLKRVAQAQAILAEGDGDG